MTLAFLAGAVLINGTALAVVLLAARGRLPL